MEAYTLDPLLRRSEVIDLYESFIWTERWRDLGDSELYVPSTRANRQLLTEGVKLASNVSDRVMEIKRVEDALAEDGKKMLTIKAKDLGEVVDSRLLMASNGSAWTHTGKPADVARKMFDDICRLGLISPDDIIPFIQPASAGTLYPPTTLLEPQSDITWDQPIGTLYAALKSLCDSYDLGFRLVRNADSSQLYFDIYTGSDRTTQQSALAPVIFSPGLDNLKNVSRMGTIEGAKNVAYVVSEHGTAWVYGNGVAPDVEGFERKVLLVQASGITAQTPNIPQALEQLGREELAKTRAWSAFDGEISDRSGYIYGEHYFLGDIVEMRDDDGFTNNMRVTEQIFASDREGVRSYPTLAIATSVTPGSWLSWEFNQTWSELGLETWAEQP